MKNKSEMLFFDDIDIMDNDVIVINLHTYTYLRIVLYNKPTSITKFSVKLFKECMNNILYFFVFHKIEINYLSLHIKII